MTSPEIFYLHIQGEQRGPYTIQQIDHLLNSGLIPIETLFWREGMDQWTLVTDLVSLRKRANPWIKPAIALAVALVILALIRIFGPVALMGWHEANQHQYTAQAAYWRARETVRNRMVLEGTLVEFAPFERSAIQLSPPAFADVILHGEVSKRDGGVRPESWRVSMKYDEQAREWSGGPVEVVTPAR